MSNIMAAQMSAGQAGAHLILEAHGQTDPGPDGKVNEDTWVIRDTVTGGQVLVVCDGMGGMGRGDEASKLAATLLVDRLASCADPGFDALIESITEVDQELRGALCREEAHRHPGSTTAVAHIHQGRVTVGWVGDSSVLLVRNGEVVSRTRGHRLVQKLIESGMMSELDAKDSPMGRILSRSLGGRSTEEEVVKPGLLEKWVLQEGDHLVLCSDGLTDFVPVEEIAQSLDGPLRDLPDRLIRLAKERDADDNITVLVARCRAFEPGSRLQVGDPWPAPADPSRATLPPADYRSGILSRAELKELQGLSEEKSSGPSNRLLLASAAAVLVIGLMVLGVLLLIL